jgi:hypothetical protein
VARPIKKIHCHSSIEKVSDKKLRGGREKNHMKGGMKEEVAGARPGRNGFGC